jgi:hypothetical protein
MDAEQSKQAASVASVAIVQLGAVGIICLSVIGLAGYGLYALKPSLDNMAAAMQSTAFDLAKMRDMAEAQRLTTLQNQKIFREIRQSLQALNARIARNNSSRKMQLSGGSHAEIQP